MNIAFVALESVYPARSGGTVRMAALIRVIENGGHAVTILDPARCGIHPRPRSVGHFLRLGPRQGSLRMRAGMAQAAAEADADVVVASISYLAHYLRTKAPLIIDFQNIEGRRYQSIAANESGIHKLTARLEALKARWWEPRVARRAAMAIACTEEDAKILRRWGANVLIFPHSAGDVEPVPPSSTRADVLYLASGGYRPNDEAGRWLVEEVWPLVVRRRPNARLRIVGRGTSDAYSWVDDPTVTVVGEVESLREELSRCSLAVGPVRTGAGAQLKVVTTLAHGRTMVVTPHTMQSVPAEAKDFVKVADDPLNFAVEVSVLIGDMTARHELEAGLLTTVDSWEANGSSFSTALERIAEELGK